MRADPRPLVPWPSRLTNFTLDELCASFAAEHRQFVHL
jgi:hypothetical protein